MTTGECGSEDTQSGDPCELSATYPDGRCKYHTDHDTDGANSDRHTGVNVRLAGPTHQRVKAHNRDSEVSLSATIDRALDALEREKALPEAVTEVMTARAGLPDMDFEAVDADEIVDELTDADGQND